MGASRALWAAGDRMTFVLTGEDTGGDCFVMEQVVPRHVRPSVAATLHSSRGSTLWYVQAGSLAGSTSATRDGGRPGSILPGVRPASRTRVSADSAELRVLVVTMPAGLREAFFLAHRRAGPRRRHRRPPTGSVALADDRGRSPRPSASNCLGP